MPLQVLYIITLNLERVKLVNKVIKMMVTFPQKILCAKRWTYLVLGWTQFLRFPMVLGPTIQYSILVEESWLVWNFFYEAWPNQWTDQTSDQIVSSLGFLEEFDWILNICFKVQFMDLDLGLIQHYCVSLYHDVARYASIALFLGTTWIQSKVWSEIHTFKFQSFFVLFGLYL